MKHTAAIVIIALALSGMLAGCDTQAQNKQAAVQRWEKSTAYAKLPTVENLIERNQLDEARKTLVKCLQADPGLAVAHFLMGRVYFIENRNADARTSFEQAVALDDTLDAAWYHLGVLAALDGDDERAMDAYQKALTLKPAEAEYAITVAQLYMHTGCIDQAFGVIEERLRTQPRSRDLLICMAELNHVSGRPDQTIAHYEQAILINAKDQQVLESLGGCYIAQKDWVKATRTFERLFNLVTEESRKESVLETLALCAFNAGRYGQAVNYYDKLSVLRRDDADVWLNMAQAALGADQYERAADNAARALQLKRSWPQAYAVMGAAHYLQGKYDEAVRSFSYARSDDEVGGFAWFMTGRCYARLGQTAKAEAAYKKAGDLAGDGPLMTRFLKEKADAI
jgi:tetratricopeptide (TPR) repeat protein